MPETPWLVRLFDAIDAKDADAFAGFLTEDVVFRFGNAPEVRGRRAVRDMVDGFFGSLAGIRHAVRASWAQGNSVIAHGEVAYTRRDGSELRVPFANVLTLEGACVREYLIFVDASAL